MKLQIGHGRQLLAQVFDGTQHIESVERSLERQMRVDALEHSWTAHRECRGALPRQALHAAPAARARDARVFENLRA